MIEQEEKLEGFKVLIREKNNDDHNFIMSSWLKSYKTESYFAKRIRTSIFYKYHHTACETILKRDNTRVIIGCDPKNPAVIWGYMVLEPHPDTEKWIIHYAYTKAAFRKLGVQHSILEAVRVNPNESIATHWTQTTDTLIKKYTELLYIPYLI